MSATATPAQAAAAASAPAPAAAAASSSSAPSASSMRLFVTCDLSAIKDGVVTVDSKTATVKDLKAAILLGLNIAPALALIPSGAPIMAKVLSADTPMHGFAFTGVNYGSAKTIEFGNGDAKGNDDNKSLCSAVGLKDGMTVVLRVPPALKPKTRRARKSKDDDGDGSTKKSGSERSIDDYKGLTPKNALEKWLAAEEGSKKRTLCFEFVCMNASEIMRSKAFTELKKDLVVELFKSDLLTVEKESEVLDGAVAWAKAETGRSASSSTDAKSDSKDGGVKELLESSGIMNLIRFPTMELNDVAFKLSSSNLVDQASLLSLFTYLGSVSAARAAASSPDDVKLPSLDSNLKKWSAKPRTGMSIGKQRWERAGNGLIISKDNNEVTNGTTTNWTAVYGKYKLKEISKTDVYWEITVNQMGTYLAVGVAAENSNVNQNTSYGADAYAWVWYAQTGQKVNSMAPQHYSTAFTTGTVVGVHADLKSKNLTFYRNGTNLGVAYNVPNLAECVPLVSCYAAGDRITAKWNARKPKA